MKSVILCQRFNRRIRQCGAFELGIFTRVARLNELKLTENCLPRISHWTLSLKNLSLQVSSLKVCAQFKKTNSELAVLFLASVRHRS